MKKIAGIAALSLLLLSACNSTPEEIDNQSDQAINTNQPEDMGSATPISEPDNTQATEYQQETLTAQELLEQPDSPLSARVIYFEYDSAKVNDESMALLEAHGEFIASNGNVNVTLTGHADERGSREYNIALGDRRAQSVRRILLFQGASADQIETISYGEEQPAEYGHDAASWAKNRRVELQYQIR